MKTTVRPQFLLEANAFVLQAAFADINIDESRSVYYWLGSWTNPAVATQEAPCIWKEFVRGD